MRADVEIRKRGHARAATATIFLERLACHKRGGIGQVQLLKSFERRIQRIRIGIADADLSIDDWVYGGVLAIHRKGELLGRPVEPFWIAGADIDEDV